MESKASSERFHEPPQSLGSPLYARKVGDQDSGGYELEVRWSVRKRNHSLDVASVVGIESRRTTSTFSCDIAYS